MPIAALALAALGHPACLAGQHAPSPDTLRLTLADAHRLTLEGSPSFLAAREMRAIGQGDLRQARLLAFNPQLEVETPGAASDAGFGRYEAAFSQEIEWAGQRGLRINVAESALRRAEESVRDAARVAVAAASEAYYSALAAQRRLALAEQILASNERLLAAVRTQLREGEISALEASLAEIEVARGRAGVLAARREARSTALTLKRAIGLAPDTPTALAGDLPAPPDPLQLQADSLVHLALQRRPDLAAHAAAVIETESAARLASREGVPNFEVRALAEREEASGETRFGIGFGLPVPLWNRNQGVATRTRAQARQATWSRTAAELQVRTEVLDAYQSYLTASEEAGIFERDVLQPARSNQQLLETAYREGKIDLPALLLLRNQLLDAELSYWDAWLAHRRSLVALEAATATIGTDPAGTDNDLESR